MKRRTCTKSGFSGLGLHLLCLPNDGYNLTVLPQFLTLKAHCLDLNFWLSYFPSVVGLEPYVVHSQSRPDPVFPEHSTGVGPLYLSVVAGPFLLPSSLLPWPRTHSNVLPLHCQDGETSHRLWSVFSLLFKVFHKTESRCKKKCLLVFLHMIPNINRNILTNLSPIHLPLLSCPVQVLGFLLASFGFVEFFYILLERSQEIQQHMVFLLSPIIRSMTVVNTVALSWFYSNVYPHHYICPNSELWVWSHFNFMIFFYL